jgi:putative glutamine amidotransferase
VKALIAVAGRDVEAGGVQGWPSATAVAAPGTYIEALQRAGGREAVLMPNLIDESDAKSILNRFDGLLLLGGGDVDPARYGATPKPEVYGVSTVRDSFEIALVRSGIDLGIPILAVCRGVQVLNVALGGTLEQHIPERSDVVEHGSGYQWQRHSVVLAEGSLAAKTMNVSVAECSSHHHQAIDALGEGLSAVGWAPDRVVEAVEMEEGWVLGVQWHPEMTAAIDPSQQALFDSLVERAASFTERR